MEKDKKEDVSTAWGQRLKYALKVRGVKQAELADQTGNKPPSVSGWINGGTVMLGGDNAYKVCIYLRINPKWLFFGLGPSGLEDGVKINGKKTVDVLALPGNNYWPFKFSASEYDSLDEDQKEKIEARVRTYIEDAQVNKSLKKAG